MSRAQAWSGAQKQTCIKELKARIGALEAEGARFEAPARLAPRTSQNSGLEACDPTARWRAKAGLHEARPEAYLDGPGALAFAALQLAALPGDRPIVWVGARGEPRLDFGAPCPDGLARRGLEPARVARVEARDARDALWAMEEALKAGALVLGRIGAAGAYDLTASKRLHAAAARAGSCLFAVRAHDRAEASAALTRWRVAPVSSPPAPWTGAGGLPGLAAPRWRAVLERARGAPPEDHVIEWSDEAFRSSQPAPMADRPARPGEHVRRAAG